ncbi:unnamed protein product [Prunus armeniaca]
MVENLLLPQGIAADSASKPPPVEAGTLQLPTATAGATQPHLAGTASLHGLMTSSSTLQLQTLVAEVAA